MHKPTFFQDKCCEGLTVVIQSYGMVAICIKYCLLLFSSTWHTSWKRKWLWFISCKLWLLNMLQVYSTSRCTIFFSGNYHLAALGDWSAFGYWCNHSFLQVTVLICLDLRYPVEWYSNGCMACIQCYPVFKVDIWWCSLFLMKITTSITKSSHKDHGPCYLHLQIFFWYIHSPPLLESECIRNISKLDLSKLDHSPLFSDIYCKTSVVWGLISIWLTNATHSLYYILC